MEHRYQPMHKPRKTVTPDDMAKVLAKRTQSQVAVKAESTAQSPKERLLGWQPPRKEFGGAFMLESVCKRFQIHASKSANFWTYESLICASGWNNVLGLHSTKDEAIDRCEAEARSLQARSGEGSEGGRGESRFPAPPAEKAPIAKSHS